MIGVVSHGAARACVTTMVSTHVEALRHTLAEVELSRTGSVAEGIPEDGTPVTNAVVTFIITETFKEGLGMEEDGINVGGAVPVPKTMVEFVSPVGMLNEAVGAVPVPMKMVEFRDPVGATREAVVNPVPCLPPSELLNSKFVDAAADGAIEIDEFADPVGTSKEADVGAVPVTDGPVELADPVGAVTDIDDTAVPVPMGNVEFVMTTPVPVPRNVEFAVGDGPAVVNPVPSLPPSELLNPKPADVPLGNVEFSEGEYVENP